MRVAVVSVVFLGLCVVVAPAAPAQGARKVYISVDLEGISGVTGDDQTSAGQPEYGCARKLMAEDANAAIRGAFAGGATEVVVNDSHGGQRNLLPEDLDPRARLISHSFKRHGMMEGLDETLTRCSSSATTPSPMRRVACSRTPARAWCATSS